MRPSAQLAAGQRGPSWIGTLLYIPSLYAGGWLLVRPLPWLVPGLSAERINLLGTVAALLLLLLSLPLRLRLGWGVAQPWRRLGVMAPPAELGRAFLRGLLKALMLLTLVGGTLLISGQARWAGELGPDQAWNALALLVGVGFAEEVVFRGWLWGELEPHLGASRALLAQALVFSLVHTRFNLGLIASLGYLGGLTLLGLALALQRRADGGVLWGAIGLHGGLVAGWFLLQGGLLDLQDSAPAWLVGPGGTHPNPIGGLIGWLGLALLIGLRRRYWVARSGAA